MKTTTPVTPDDVLSFWFAPATRPRWFDATPAFDARLRQRFGSAVPAALAGALSHWQDTPTGMLALILLLDQIAYSINRGSAQAYAGRAPALALAKRALARGDDRQLTPVQQSFLYLPFMHSENLADQERSVALYAAAGLEQNLVHAKHHRDIIRRFGRFPHRNEILGRESTPAEREYLVSPGAFRG